MDCTCCLDPDCQQHCKTCTIVAKQLEITRRRVERVMKTLTSIDSNCIICKTKFKHTCSLFRSDTYNDLITLMGTDSSILKTCKVLSCVFRLQRCPFKNILDLNPARIRITAEFLKDFLDKLISINASSMVISYIRERLLRASIPIAGYPATDHGFSITFYTNTLGLEPQMVHSVSAIMEPHQCKLKTDDPDYQGDASFDLPWSSIKRIELNNGLSVGSSLRPSVKWRTDARCRLTCSTLSPPSLIEVKCHPSEAFSRHGYQPFFHSIRVVVIENLDALYGHKPVQDGFSQAIAWIEVSTSVGD